MFRSWRRLTVWGLVLVSQHVSVTCSVEESEVFWYLTKESGRVPVSCSHSSGVLAKPMELRRSVLVVQLSACWWATEIQWSEVAVARLTREALFVVERRFLPLLVRVWKDVVDVESDSMRRLVRRWFAEADAFFGLLDGGAFSTGFSCACVVTGVCKQCKQLEEESRRFIVQDRYEGVFPLGKEHWWTGVTDAVQVGQRQKGCLCMDDK